MRCMPTVIPEVMSACLRRRYVIWLSLVLAGMGLTLGCRAPAASAGARLEARVVDDATGAPLAARIAVTNPDGKFIEIDGKHAHVQYLSKRWCYVDGSFTLAIPASGATIEIRRGLETLPLSATIPGGASGKATQKSFRLRRWIDMCRQGYFNGDMHAHLPAPAEAVGQMRAEDLNALTLYTVADPEYHLPTNDSFTGRLDVHSTPDCQIRVGQEIQEWQMGHIGLVGLPHLVPG